jgi:hypothetical protein
MGFEPTIPVFEREKTFRALYRAASAVVILLSLTIIKPVSHSVRWSLVTVGCLLPGLLQSFVLVPSWLSFNFVFSSICFCDRLSNEILL